MTRRRPRFRVRRQRRWLVAAIVLIVLIVAERRGWLLVPADDDLPRYHGRTAAIEHIIDGDTLDVALPDELNGSATTRIRLWGIDCPELAHFDQPEQPLAREAADFARAAAANGREVRLVLEAHRPRDSFGRVLAHVEFIDGGSLNEQLLEAGLARADDRWPHTRLTRYAQVELAARRAKAGLWSDAAPATTRTLP